jgi:hypothetical protein
MSDSVEVWRGGVARGGAGTFPLPHSGQAAFHDIAGDLLGMWKMPKENPRGCIIQASNGSLGISPAMRTWNIADV